MPEKSCASEKKTVKAMGSISQQKDFLFGCEAVTALLIDLREQTVCRGDENILD